MSLTMVVITGASTIIAGLAALWARATVKNARQERDRIQASQDALEAAGKRLDEARRANQAPISTKNRNYFEKQP